MIFSGSSSDGTMGAGIATGHLVLSMLSVVSVERCGSYWLTSSHGSVVIQLAAQARTLWVLFPATGGFSLSFQWLLS